MNEWMNEWMNGWMNEWKINHAVNWCMIKDNIFWTWNEKVAAYFGSIAEVSCHGFQRFDNLSFAASRVFNIA